jgi:glycosyltransferase involved in cell wall biosynthesis
VTIGEQFDGTPASRAARSTFSRALVVAQGSPWPPRGGGDLRTGNTLAALRSAGIQAGLAALTPPQTPVDPHEGVGTWFPERSDPAAQDAAGALDWIRDTNGHPSDRWWTPQAKTALARAIAELDPQLVVLEHLWTRRALELLAACSARRILCAHNVEGPLHAALARSSDGQAPAALAALMARRTSEIEATTVAAVDQVWACSDADAESFRECYPQCAPVKVIPNAIEIGAPRANTPALERPLLLFIGSFGYPPNVQGALWLGEQVIPALHAGGIDARLRLIGADPPGSVRRLAAHPAIEVMGFVEDLAPHLEEAAVIPVPIFAGSGTRFKVLEAFGAGVAVVSTRKGVEGIDATPGEHYLAAETLEEFTTAIRNLSTNRELYANLTQGARALVEHRYSLGGVYEAVAAALDGLARTSRSTEG